MKEAMEARGLPTVAHNFLRDAIDAAPDSFTAIEAMLLDSLKHSILDPCPLLAAHLGARLDSIVASFITALLADGHRMDWTVHLELGWFLGISDSALWQELMIASLAKWLTPGDRQGTWIALGGSVLPERFLLGRLSTSVSGNATVSIGSCPNAFPRPFFVQVGHGPFVGLGTDWCEYVPRVIRPEAREAADPSEHDYLAEGTKA